MELALERIDDILVITVPGRVLDAARVDDFKETVSAILKNEKKAVLDLSKLDFVDSSGLAAIVSFARTLEAADGSLRISGLNKQVRWLFELTKMEAVCGGPFESKRDAVESLLQVEAQ
ncbi:MAG: STAS domain-containing protein [Candidatus Coatesbacteria bacterium]|nr:STAS domain-containing protein [Candidatus Coatesbacteria bacterium]